MKVRHFKTKFWFLFLIAASSLVQGQQAALQVGYAVVTPDPGQRRPVGTALFSVTNSQNVLVSQAGVEGVEPIRRGRIFVDEVGSRTGFALVNPGPLDATALLTLRDSTGSELMQKTQILAAGRHLA